MQKVGVFGDKRATAEWPFACTTSFRSYLANFFLSSMQDHKETHMATKKLKTAKKLQKTKPLMSVRNLRKPV